MHMDLRVTLMALQNSPYGTKAVTTGAVRLPSAQWPQGYGLLPWYEITMGI